MQNDINYVRFIIFLTTGVDVLWLLFWIPYYNDTEMAKWNYGLHMFVVVVSIAELALKVFIFIRLFQNDKKPKQRAPGQGQQYLGLQ